MVKAQKMKPEDWHIAVDQMQESTVKIKTKSGTGTGFVSWHKSGFQSVVTAAHVVRDAHFRGESIQIENLWMQKEIVLKKDKRVVEYDAEKDTAVITFDDSKNHLNFPKKLPAPMDPEDRLRPGVEIGWLGYPGVVNDSLCFFSGRVSFWVQGDTAYLVDGFAMNGVSGGPAFVILDNSLYVIGLVTSQIPNSGEDSPGLCVVRHIERAQQLTDKIKQELTRDTNK